MTPRGFSKGATTPEDHLDPIGQYLQSHPFALAIVVAYTDMRGDSGQDLKLSEARAYVLRKYIVDHFKLQDTLIRTKGLGKQESVGTRPEDDMEVLVYATPPATPGRPAADQLPQ